MVVFLVDILGYVIGFSAGYFFYKLLGGFLQTRKSIPLRLGGWYLLTISLTMPVLPNDPVNITLTMPLFLIALILAYAESRIVWISTALIFYPIMVAYNYMWYDFTGRIFFRFFAGYGENANHICSTLSRAIVPLFWYFVWQKYGKRLERITRFLDKKSWILLDVICLASLASVFVSIYFTPDETYKVYPCMIASIITGIGCLLLATYLAERIQTEQERRKLQLQQDYYEELERNQTQIRKLRHDMNNHLAAVGGLLEQEKTEAALEYLHGLYEHMQTGSRHFCADSIVNALLNLKYNAAVEAEIDTFFHIGIDGLTEIDDISLCTLFANSLDNAIEACRKITDRNKRRLSLKARYSENGYFSLEISNSKINPVSEKQGVFMTDKDNQKMHGLGIASMKEIVERYKGTIDIQYTEEEFTVVILISF